MSKKWPLFFQTLGIVSYATTLNIPKSWAQAKVFKQMKVFRAKEPSAEAMTLSAALSREITDRLHDNEMRSRTKHWAGTSILQSCVVKVLMMHFRLRRIDVDWRDVKALLRSMPMNSFAG